LVEAKMSRRSLLAGAAVAGAAAMAPLHLTTDRAAAASGKSPSRFSPIEPSSADRPLLPRDSPPT
jgi:secreted PhoX family phosphatase